MGGKQATRMHELASKSGKNPASYLAEKALSHRLILLGTRHGNPRVSTLIADSLPLLASQAGISVLFAEVPSSQQDVIDKFRKGTGQVIDIGIHEIIATPEYLGILTRAKELGMDIVAIDADTGSRMTRDAWMARCIEDYYAAHPGSRGLVVVGNSHVYKNIDWGCGVNQSLADHIKALKPFSVVMWPGALKLGEPLALDVDHETFLGLKDPTLSCMNVLSGTCLATTADGVILLGDEKTPRTRPGTQP